MSWIPKLDPMIWLYQGGQVKGRRKIPLSSNQWFKSIFHALEREASLCGHPDMQYIVGHMYWAGIEGYLYWDGMEGQARALDWWAMCCPIKVTHKLNSI